MLGIRTEEMTALSAAVWSGLWDFGAVLVQGIRV